MFISHFDIAWLLRNVRFAYLMTSLALFVSLTNT